MIVIFLRPLFSSFTVCFFFWLKKILQSHVDCFFSVLHGLSFFEKVKVGFMKWGVGFTIIIVILWPLLSLPIGQFSKGYWGFAKRTWTIQGYAIHEICSCNARVHASVQFQQPPDGKC